MRISFLSITVFSALLLVQGCASQLNSSATDQNRSRTPASISLSNLGSNKEAVAKMIRAVEHIISDRPTVQEDSRVEFRSATNMNLKLFGEDRSSEQRKKDVHANELVRVRDLVKQLNTKGIVVKDITFSCGSDPQPGSSMDEVCYSSVVFR